MKVEERLLKYVGYHTTSDEASDKIPSSDREFALARELESELKELGLSKVVLTDHCYVYGLLPATAGMEHKKAVGFIAHMDTAPDFSGENVKPQLLRHYDGSDVLLRGSGEYLRVSNFPELKALSGRTLITTDGTTLLGADDKAGVAEIMTALEQIIAEGTPHGDIWVGFTPDEEVGKGADLFDLDYFEADFAYTLDGDYEGEVAYENFNAASAEFTIKGVNVHPGEAKDIMVNAALVGCEIAAALPANETPATTEGREGFYHLCDMSGDVASAHLSYIVRDHDKALFAKRLDTLRSLEIKMNKKYGEGTVSLTITHSYENMLSIIMDNMYIIDLAKAAIEENGLEPLSRLDDAGAMAARAAIAALHTGRPCRMTWRSSETLLEGVKRHPFHIYYKAGAKRDGTLTAIEVRGFVDGGAYLSKSKTTTWRSGIEATGPYRVEHVDVCMKAAYTNNCYAGSVRGFGSPTLAHTLPKPVM